MLQGRMDARAAVASNIRRYRVEKGLSQEVLAVDAAVDRTYVSRLERGLENPTVGVLEKLAIALDVQVSDLVRIPEAGEPAPSVLPSGRKSRRSST